jgi:hypothetical protein
MSPPEFKAVEESVYDILDAIRGRPGMWIAEAELVRVYAFLTGYTSALGRRRQELRAEQPDFCKFNDWVAHRLGYSNSTSGWYNMIRGHSSSEQQAFEKFYELLAEFKKNAATA